MKCSESKSDRCIRALLTLALFCSIVQFVIKSKRKQKIEFTMASIFPVSRIITLGQKNYFLISRIITLGQKKIFFGQQNYSFWPAKYCFRSTILLLFVSRIIPFGLQYYCCWSNMIFFSAISGN